MPPTDPIAELQGAAEPAPRGLRDGEAPEPAPSLDRPPKPDLGDYSSNAAMLLAGPLGDNPRAVAERLRGELEGSLGGGAGGVDATPRAGAPRAPGAASKAASAARWGASIGSRSPAPASSTSSSPTPGTGGRWPGRWVGGENRAR